MSESIESSSPTFMWGRSQYKYSGQHLNTGNRCGHNPVKPAWHLYATPETRRDIPKAQQQLLEAVERYYARPDMLPTLRNLSGSKNLDGTPRQNRSEGREAECLVLKAVLQSTEFASLRVGTPHPSGKFIPRSCAYLAKVAGLVDPASDPARPEPSQRFWRAFRRLKLSGAFDVHRQYEEKADGTKRARPAIKNVNVHFLVSMGVLGYEQLTRFRDVCSKMIREKQAEYRAQFPKLFDAKMATVRLQTREIQGDIKEVRRATSAALPDCNRRKEQQRQYNMARVAYTSQLLKLNKAKGTDWLFSEVKRTFPAFERWLAERQNDD